MTALTGQFLHTFDDVSDKRLVCEYLQDVLAMACLHGHSRNPLPVGTLTAISMAGLLQFGGGE